MDKFININNNNNNNNKMHSVRFWKTLKKQSVKKVNLNPGHAQKTGDSHEQREFKTHLLQS